MDKLELKAIRERCEMANRILDNICWDDISNEEMFAMVDAIRFIPSLLAEVERLQHYNEQLEQAEEQKIELYKSVIAERDAAQNDLKMVCQHGEPCAACRWCCNRGDKFPCDKHDDWCGGFSWQWRGVQNKEEEKNV